MFGCSFYLFLKLLYILILNKIYKIIYLNKYFK
jgi:hypothetical protein